MRNCLVILLLVLLVGCSPQKDAPGSVLDTVGSIDDAVNAPIAAPDFSLVSLEGDTYSINSLRGKWIIVTFWATWCVPCREEMPTFQSLYEKYADQLEILAINDHETVEAIIAYRDEMGLSFPILLNPEQETLSEYKVLGLPITVIVNPDGLIVWQRFGAVDLGEFETNFAELIKAYQQ
jgi:thiol-disulfide isomerase/thioredoxin